MKSSDTCWDCRHLTSRPYSRPPVYCKAFPEKDGIPFQIIAGIVRHDHLLGGEKTPVFFEPRGRTA